MTGGMNEEYKSCSNVIRYSGVEGVKTTMPSMKCKRYAHSIVASENRILVFGGYDSSTSTFLSSCEKFNPKTQKQAFNSISA